MSPALHVSQARQIQRRVLLTGTAGDTYKRGWGVCYDRDYYSADDNEAATDPCGLRDKRVEKPSTTNHNWFAGVLDQTVVIPPSGEIMVNINEPGSVCQIAIGQQNAVAGTRFGLSVGAADAGRFGLPGLIGRGQAMALQTVDLRSVAMDGSAVYTHSDKTLADNGEYTSVVAGDTFVIVGFDGGDVGEYTVASRTDDTIVFAADIGDAADRGLVTGYCLAGSDETLCLAYLLDGPESGCQEVVQCVDDAAFVAMVGGFTYLAPGTLTNGDAIETIDDGTYNGQMKAIQCLGSNSTNDAEVTITHHSTSDPEQLFFKAAGESHLMMWFGAGWHQIANDAPISA